MRLINPRSDVAQFCRAVYSFYARSGAGTMFQTHQFIGSTSRKALLVVLSQEPQALPRKLSQHACPTRLPLTLDKGMMPLDVMDVLAFMPSHARERLSEVTEDTRGQWGVRTRRVVLGFMDTFTREGWKLNGTQLALL